MKIAIQYTLAAIWIAAGIAALCWANPSWGQTPFPHVPEPVKDYALPAPLRTVAVATQVALDAAIKDRRAGDRIVLAPGTYNQLYFGYNAPSNATEAAPLQFQGQAGVFVKGASIIGPCHLVFNDIDFTAPVSMAFAWDIAFIGCGSVLDDPINCNFSSSNQKVGQFRFLNCWIENSWRPGKPLGGYGIKFSPGQYIGNDFRFAGNVFRGMYRDGIAFGDFSDSATPTNNVVIENNFFSLCQDDAIEADKWFSNLVIRNNVIGGTDRSVTAGISLAPGGPGPIEVCGNSISGYDCLPIKFNTEVRNAYTKNVTVHDNTICNLTTSTMAIYFAIPCKELSDFTFTRNIVRGRGRLYVAENTWNPPNTIIDGNRLYSTGEFMAGWSALFRMWNPVKQVNIYSKDFAAFVANHAALQGYEKTGVWDTSLATVTPVKVGNFLTTELCRYKFGAAPTATATPTPNPTVTPTPAPKWVITLEMTGIETGKATVTGTAVKQ